MLILKTFSRNFRPLYNTALRASTQTFVTQTRLYSDKIKLYGVEYPTDDWTNINKSIKDKLGRNLIHQQYHPLNHLTNKIKHFFNKTYTWHSSTPLFAVFDNFVPVVSLEQNFDSLLTAKDHVSRNKKDSFYVNKNYLLRAHTTAHTAELIRSGLNAFLTFGDVYRRDEIDKQHYPIFHQCDGARLYIKTDLFPPSDDVPDPNKPDPTEHISIFEKDPKLLVRTDRKQKVYSEYATEIVEYEMKTTLTNLVNYIFGSSKFVLFKRSELLK
jgi:phenylalanyl-tRNA synthetase alpha chain